MKNHSAAVQITIPMKRVLPPERRSGAPLGVCLQRQCSRALLDRARTEGHHLGSWRIVE